MWLEIVAGSCLAWYMAVLVVCAAGYVQLLRNYSTVPQKSTSFSSSTSKLPHVTIIRPVKGLEPYLYDCLAATFYQDYPSLKLTIHLCIASRDDPAFPILESLIHDFPAFDVRIFVENEDLALVQQNGVPSPMGPNPKIRNMSRGYREAQGDIIWIIDCNIWVGRGVCGRMVDKLCGFSKSGPPKPYKFVHQLPICVDVDDQLPGQGTTSLPNGHLGTHPAVGNSQPRKSWLSIAGGRLEEIFLSSSHAKFYTAINTVAIAPCIVGKSNMFRRSHLNYLTSSPTTTHPLSHPSISTPTPGSGIDFFSHNICEDHLIGDLLWRSPLPLPLPTLPSSQPTSPSTFGNHALLFTDLAIQPISAMSLRAYISRRIRWLRVRKFTVTLATLVEPGTESFLCSAYGAFALTSLNGVQKHVGIPQTWSAFVILWLCSICIWASADRTLYTLLHSGRTVEVGPNVNQDGGGIPPFARPLAHRSRRPFLEWLAAWLGREALALPIWLWAFWGGGTVVWRDRTFWVGVDMRVHEIGEDGDEREGTGGWGALLGGGRKVRRD